ncbi:unnamed protein product [Diplocarpon coronariae]
MWHHSKKSLVVLAFGLRLPVIVPAIFRLGIIFAALHAGERNLKGAISAAYTQIQICYATTAATTPCLRPSMNALNASYGAPASVESSPDATRAYSLSRLSKRNKKNGTEVTDSGKEPESQGLEPAPRIRWDGTAHHVDVLNGDQLSLESRESGQMMITKDTEGTAKYEAVQRGLVQTRRGLNAMPPFISSVCWRLPSTHSAVHKTSQGDEPITSRYPP